MEKVIITEKAVVRIINEWKDTIDPARAKELLIENIPNPPNTEDNEIEEKLEMLTKFNEELLTDGG